MGAKPAMAKEKEKTKDSPLKRWTGNNYGALLATAEKRYREGSSHSVGDQAVYDSYVRWMEAMGVTPATFEAYFKVNRPGGGKSY